MPQLRDVTLEEATQPLPGIEELRPDDIQRRLADGLFLCALGFEERCVSAPRLLAESGYAAEQAVLFQYETNREDNERNRPTLQSHLSQVSGDPVPISIQAADFPEKLDRTLSATIARCGPTRPAVTFDISACCSRGILEVLGVLFRYDISLRITYSEAATYHPTKEEFESTPEDWLTESGSGMARGVVSIWESPVYPGCNPDHLPNLLVAFPTFKRERTQKLISTSEAQVARTVWIVGVPHLPENRWRVEAMRKINKLIEADECYEVSTFHYLDSLTQLERIYQNHEATHHMLVSPLGSKLQDVGIALFLQLRPDVSVWFSTPAEYNPKQYTEGTIAVWRIDFGDVRGVVDRLRSCGKLQIV